MRDGFPFLIRLGLRPDADAKDIRRAYARELKKIDQAADPAGFQELREAYEVALQWHAHQQFVQQQANEPQAEAAPVNTAGMLDAEAGAAPGAIDDSAHDIPSGAMPAEEPHSHEQPQPEADDPYQLADQAFQKFASSMRMLVQRNDARHQSLWKTVLQRSLDDDRLLNLTARTIFEARIVHLLASGWHAGHETLFVVACEVFEWERDNRRIQQFGEAGAMVNRAIDEWKLFESMTPHAIGTFKQVLQYVRATPQPEAVAGRNDLMLFHQMASRFYTWLAVILDRAVLDNWCKAAQEEAQRPGAAPAQQMLAKQEAEPAPAKSAGWSGSTVWPLLVVLFFALRACFNMVNEPKGFYPPAQKYERPGPSSAVPRNKPAPAAPDQAPSQERIDEIRSRIDYKWPPNTPEGEYVAIYDVFIDADGTVLGMNKISSSGNKGYDAAVEKAIKETRAFPKGTKTRFTLSYGMKFSKPAPPKGNPPTQEQLRAVQDEVFYVPGSTIGPGEIKVRYEVELDDQGKVVNLKKLKASRDPAYDEVVAEALKNTKAFPPDTRRKFFVEYSRTLGRR